MKWWHISALLSSYGFFHEFKPSEPFLSQFLLDGKNFTTEVVNQEIFPVGQYTWLGLLIFVFLLTDYLRYKPVIIVGSLLGVICYCMQAWTTSLLMGKITEAFFGAFSACEVAYYTYMYAKVDKKYYQKVTSHARSAYMFGRSMGGVTAQIMISYDLMTYKQLHYISIASLVLSTIIAIVLPSVPQSTYFHRDVTPDIKALEENKDDLKVFDKGKGSKRDMIRNAFQYLKEDFLCAFTNWYVIKWSLWWALATCIYYQVTTFAQLLWATIAKEEGQELFNGAVEFSYTLLGAASAFLIGFVDLRWDLFGDISLGVLSLIQGIGLSYSGYLHSLVVVYILYVAYGAIYEAALTIATSEVAKNISEDSYALVFGINMFFSIFFQVLLTTILVDGIKADIRHQFVVYGGYYILLGIVFTILAFWNLFSYFRRKRKSEIFVENNFSHKDNND